MQPCLFCKIIAGEIPSTKVYEDENVLAILDINPVNIGHTLVIPKAHFENLYTIPDDLLSAMMLAVQKLAVAIKRAEAADGINIAMNNERAAGQLIDHAHIHIIPRHTDDGFTHWKSKRGYEPGETDMVSKKIKSGLSA